MNHILIVDDEKNITTVLSAILEAEGYRVSSFNESRPAFDFLTENASKIHLVITDLVMPEMDGMDFLQGCKKEFEHIPVVMITAHGTVESAVHALKQGAFDFIAKPFDQKELLSTVKKGLSTAKTRSREPMASRRLPFGSSVQMQEIHMLVAKTAATPSTVLIQGESGTGREFVASEVHELSDRKEKPFIKVNCSAVPADQIEMEIFGREEPRRMGRLELADQGTLFLDDIDRLPVEVQLRLLRYLQDQEFERVGGFSKQFSNVRLIAASSDDLKNRVDADEFREDLYYRLNVVPIFLPSLRERSTDIPELAHHFVQVFNRKLNKSVVSIAGPCLKKLSQAPWPGNVQQLETVIERMMLMADGSELTLKEVPPGFDEEMGLFSRKKPSMDSQIEDIPVGQFKDFVKDKTHALERNLIQQALSETEGNVTHAAEMLGLSRKGLQLKIKELNVKRDKTALR